MAHHYDSAITVFSPDGHLFQVEYAQEAVGVCGKNVIVLAVERKAIAQLQTARTVRKIYRLDDHIAMSFAGLTADARVLTEYARVECQTYRLSLEDPPSVEYITRFISEKKQLFTQSNGRRPFGVSCLIAGFDPDSCPHLYTTDPSGANAIGRNSKVALEYLEKYYNNDMLEDDLSVIKLALGALTEVVQSDSKLMEIVVITRTDHFKVLDDDFISPLLVEIEAEKRRRPPQPEAFYHYD